MKRTIALATIAFLSAAFAFAQNLEEAINAAKQANDAIVAKNGQAALDGFKAALASAEQCTEEGAADLVSTCKTGIVLAYGTLANNQIEAGQMEEALITLDEGIEAAKEYGSEDEIAKYNEKKLQLFQALAGSEIKAASVDNDPVSKKSHFERALAKLDAALIMDPDNGKTMLQKGQVLSAIGEKEAAIDLYEQAKSCGMEAEANKQLSNIYVKEASQSLKAQKYKEALSAAKKSNSYSANANAYKIAGIAAQKLNDSATAVSNYEAYLKLNPSDAQIKAACEALKATLK